MAEINMLEGEVNTGRRPGGLLFRFGAIFAVLTILTLIATGIATYILQQRILEEQVSSNVSSLSEYLQKLIKADGEDFVYYQEYMLEHANEVLIPADFDGDYLPALDKYSQLFAQQYPGKTLGKDISFDELSDEVKNAFAVYTHEYWLFVFESAARTFDVEYTYYITPTGEPNHMYYIIDALRDIKGQGGGLYINLLLDIEEDPNMYPVMWEVWESNRTVDKHDVFDNQYGHNYAYYSPLYIDGQKIGIIAVDVAIDKVNKEIVRNTLIPVFVMALVLITGVILILLFIDKKYISKLVNLSNGISQYTRTKDPAVVHTIGCSKKSHDEITDLANQTSVMITTLDTYIKNLVDTTKELSETKQQASELQALTNKDPITGIRNKIAYDEEIKKLEAEVAVGLKEFGLAMVDLNFLIKINDTYGEEKGNIAIKKLCVLVCNIFQHSPVFKVGGDEFAVILKNRDYENVDSLVKKFNDEIEQFSGDISIDPWEKISAAIGVALFDPKEDTTVDDVFRKADAQMCTRKHEMKAARE
jgi:diguanylate cyclase (GGDEF)-like protein